VHPIAGHSRNCLENGLYKIASPFINSMLGGRILTNCLDNHQSNVHAGKPNLSSLHLLRDCNRLDDVRSKIFRSCGPIGIIDLDSILSSDDMGGKVRQIIKHARLEEGCMGRWTGYPPAKYRWT
jgi:hypothetical protein